MKVLWLVSITIPAAAAASISITAPCCAPYTASPCARPTSGCVSASASGRAG